MIVHDKQSHMFFKFSSVYMIKKFSFFKKDVNRHTYSLNVSYDFNCELHFNTYTHRERNAKRHTSYISTRKHTERARRKKKTYHRRHLHQVLQGTYPTCRPPSQSKWQRGQGSKERHCCRKPKKMESGDDNRGVSYIREDQERFWIKRHVE